MEFALTEDQKMLQESLTRTLGDAQPAGARAPVRRRTASTARPTSGSGSPNSACRASLIAEEHGGLGLGLLDAALAAEALGAAVAPGAVPGPAVLAPLALMPGRFGRAAGEVAAEARVGRGHRRRRDLRGGGRRAGRRGRHGQGRQARRARRCSCSMRAGADLLIVADTCAAACIWSRRRAGLTQIPMPSIDATRRLAELDLRRRARPSRWPASRRAGPAARRRPGSLLAADTLGAGQAMLDKAVAYAKERRQFGRVIGSLPGGEASVRRDGRRAGAGRVRWSGTPPTPSTSARTRRR